MWEDVLSVVDSEIDGDESRLFLQEPNWDGTQYIRLAVTKVVLMGKAPESQYLRKGCLDVHVSLLWCSAINRMFSAVDIPLVPVLHWKIFTRRSPAGLAHSSQTPLTSP